MYRDLVRAPERVTVNGREFWYQEFYNLSGSLEAVRLYAEDGAFIAEFSDYSAMLHVMKELAKGETA